MGQTYRFWNAFTVLLIGVGVLALALGLFTDLYEPKYGVVGMVALWVIAVALRVYTLTADRDEEYGRYRPRSLYDRIY